MRIENRQAISATPFSFQYDRDGILVVEDFLSPKEVESMRQGCWQLVEDMDPAVHKGVFSGTSTKNDKQVSRPPFFQKKTP